MTEVTASSSAAQTRPHGTAGTGKTEWYTPSKYVELAREVLGVIDLDPASCDLAQKTVQAGRYFTVADDGLQHEWHGRIFVNPPYVRGTIDAFVDKVIAEVASSRTTAAILLAHGYIDVAWFHRACIAADAVCFTRGRIKFYGPDGRGNAPTHGSAFFYLGADVERFRRVFQRIGFVVPLRARSTAGVSP